MQAQQVPMFARIQILERKTVKEDDKEYWEDTDSFAQRISNELNNGWRIVSIADTSGTFSEVMMIKSEPLGRPIPKKEVTAIPPDAARAAAPGITPPDAATKPAEEKPL